MHEVPARGPAASAIVGKQKISFASGVAEVPVYDRDKLGRDCTVTGPAVITQLDSTTLLLPGQTAEVHRYGSLIVREASA